MVIWEQPITCLKSTVKSQDKVMNVELSNNSNVKFQQVFTFVVATLIFMVLRCIYLSSHFYSLFCHLILLVL